MAEEERRDEAEEKSDNNSESSTENNTSENNSGEQPQETEGSPDGTEESEETSADEAKKKKKKDRPIWRSQRDDLQKLCKILMYVTTGVVAVFTVLFAILVFGHIEMTMSDTLKYYVNVYIPFMIMFVACWLTSLGIVLFWRRYPSWISTRKTVTFWTVIDLIQVVFQMVSWYSLIGSL